MPKNKPLKSIWNPWKPEKEAPVPNLSELPNPEAKVIFFEGLLQARGAGLLGRRLGDLEPVDNPAQHILQFLRGGKDLYDATMQNGGMDNQWVRRHQELDRRFLNGIRRMPALTAIKLPAEEYLAINLQQRSKHVWEDGFQQMIEIVKDYANRTWRIRHMTFDVTTYFAIKPGHIAHQSTLGFDLTPLQRAGVEWLEYQAAWEQWNRALGDNLNLNDDPNRQRRNRAM